MDKDKRIRGIYDGTEANKVDTLIDEMKVLLYETEKECVKWTYS